MQISKDYCLNPDNRNQNEGSLHRHIPIRKCPDDPIGRIAYLMKKQTEEPLVPYEIDEAFRLLLLR